MDSFAKKIPLPFVWFYLLIGLYALTLITLPFNPRVQMTVMKKFHLAHASFGKWAPLQFLPSMYNFSNQIWITLQKTDPQRFITAPNKISNADPTWTNHYPFWPVTFVERENFFHPPQDHYIYLRTRFQAQELWTVYHMNKKGLWKEIR